MSLLSPTRDIYAYGNYIDKNTKNLMNYSPQSNYGGMSQYLSTNFDTKRNSSSKKSVIM